MVIATCCGASWQRVTRRAKNGEVGRCGIVMDMRTVQVLVLISAVGALVVGQIEQHQPVPTPFRTVELTEFWADRHV
jgi:hypothetical protein